MLLGSPRPTGPQWVALVVGAVGITLATAAPGAGAGRPVPGTLLSGWLYQSGGLAACLAASAAMLFVAGGVPLQRGGDRT